MIVVKKPPITNEACWYSYVSTPLDCPNGEFDETGTCVPLYTWPEILNQTTSQCETPVIDEKNNGPKECNQMEVNPINIGTGNKVEIQTDYQGSGVYPLIFQRTYNSNDSITSTRIGAHWRHSYDKTITVPESDMAKVLRADGQVQTFIHSGGAWNADVDIPAKLNEFLMPKTNVQVGNMLRLMTSRKNTM